MQSLRFSSDRLNCCVLEAVPESPQTDTAAFPFIRISIKGRWQGCKLNRAPFLPEEAAAR